MKIAIVDDEQLQRDTIQDYIHRYSTENGVAADVIQHSSGEELLRTFEDQYDVIIFDVDMPGRSGLDIAKEIRERGSDAVILFITNMAQYAINGYEVDAVDYVIKPIGYYDFAMKFSKAAKRVRKNDSKLIALECVDGMRSVMISKIIYVEIMGHYLVYHDKENDFKVRGSMAEHSSELLAYGFVRIHKSYLVNLKYLDNLKANEAVLRGKANIVLPIGRAYKESRIKAYLDYLKG